MRMGSWLLGLALLVAAAPASAGPLAFRGTVGVVIGTLPPITVTGSGVAQVEGAGTALESFSLPAGVFATAVSIPVSDPAAFPLAGVQADPSNGAGSFAGATLAGAMPVLGSATVCLFYFCDADPIANVVVPFTVNGTRGIGLGGAPITAMGLVDVTVQGATWTAGTAVAGGATVMGFVEGPLGGGASTAAQVGGRLQLVTPITILTSIGASPTLPAFGILTLEFVPEPGTLALVALGVAGLAALGRSRRV